MSSVDGGIRPVPRVARERWLDSLVRAGWPAAGDQGTGDRHTGDRNTGDGPGSERVAVGEALGRVTAAPVVARWPSPRTDCAAMDGIAVRAADLAAALPVPAKGQPENVRADGQAVRLPAGLFEWIDTGDPMPAGADTVIVRERLLPQADGGMVITGASGGQAGGGHGQVGRAHRDPVPRRAVTARRRPAGDDRRGGDPPERLADRDLVRASGPGPVPWRANRHWPAGPRERVEPSFVCHLRNRAGRLVA